MPPLARRLAASLAAVLAAPALLAGPGPGPGPLAAVLAPLGAPAPAGAQTCPAPDPPPAASPPAALVAELAERAADPRFGRGHLGVSIWVEGYGEVFANRPDETLRPASNQKLATAVGVLQLLGADATLTTRVLATGPVVDGVLQGDLVLVGGGDPTLGLRGTHSIDALAGAVADAGVTRVTGRLLFDDWRYDRTYSVAAWPAGDPPGNIGPVSALMVAANRYRTDRTFLRRPALANTALFRLLLAVHGVRVAGATDRTPAPATGTELASRSSAPVGDLVEAMLLTSDNTVAEALVKEVGVRVSGQGTTAAGVAAVESALATLCLPPVAPSVDGSGLSRNDRRTARELRRLLQVAGAQPWFAHLDAGLPVAGVSGTLTRRFVDTPSEGVVRAKTGAIRNTRSLSGFATTAGGRRVVFSVLYNGTSTTEANDAIDELVDTVVRWPG